MKREVNVFDYAGQILKAVSKGVLMTTAADGQVNTMTIGWGHLGTIWYKPVFIAYVRESRYTKAMVEKNGEFTVNIPLAPVDQNILGVCGTKSGRDMDKIKELGLTIEEADTIAAPGIKELPLTLECKVIYKQDQDPSAIDPDSLQRFYAPGSRNEGDYHTAYYGEITKAYIIE